MSIVEKLFALALQPALHPGAGPAAAAVRQFLEDKFADGSQRLNQALRKAHGRTLQTLEMALAGDSLWHKLKGTLSQGDQKAFRQQVQAMLEAAPLPDFSNKDKFRRAALAELQAARKSGLLNPISIDPKAYLHEIGALSSFADPAIRLKADYAAVHEVAVALQKANYKALGWVLGQRPANGMPLLVLAIRYFFRREVETDEKLARGLTFSQLEGLSQSQEAGLRGLHESLRQHGQVLQEHLDGLLLVATEARDAAVAGLETALDVKAEQQRQGSLLADMYQKMQELLAQNRLGQRPVHQGDSQSIREGRERQQIKELLTRYRGLPAAQQQATPALGNCLGRLGLAIGEFKEAQQAFTQAAAHAQAAPAKAEAHYNAYRAALECNDFDRALAELRCAVTLDADRFDPFPMDKYEPQRILGVGGFGATFLCRHHLTGAPVAIKSLLAEGLERDIATLFQEAAALEQVEHPAIIRPRDYGFADPGKSRPYIVMDYFEGATLEGHVKEHGCLSPDELLPLARSVSEALQTAHLRGILHRDVKPANLLVRREGATWQVRLIDFGLALKQSILEAAGSTAMQGRTIMQSAIAGTLDYAAPEQMGKVPGAKVGPPADVYGFARLCCYALFESSEPTFQDYQKVPQGWAELLGHCLQKTPDKRPADFGQVLQRLAELEIAAAKSGTVQGLAKKWFRRVTGQG